MCGRSLFAPCVIDGSINGESFLSYVEQVLPTLNPGDIVIIDTCFSSQECANYFANAGYASA